MHYRDSKLNYFVQRTSKGYADIQDEKGHKYLFENEELLNQMDKKVCHVLGRLSDVVSLNLRCRTNKWAMFFFIILSRWSPTSPPWAQTIKTKRKIRCHKNSYHWTWTHLCKRAKQKKTALCWQQGWTLNRKRGSRRVLLWVKSRIKIGKKNWNCWTNPLVVWPELEFQTFFSFIFYWYLLTTCDRKTFTYQFVTNRLDIRQKKTLKVSRR